MEYATIITLVLIYRIDSHNKKLAAQLPTRG